MAEQRIPLTWKNEKNEVVCKKLEFEKHTITVREKIAEGGSSLVYFATEEYPNSSSPCIIKEYYPVRDNITQADIHYVRDIADDSLIIESRESKLRERELRCQRINVQNEVNSCNKLCYDPEVDQNASPNFYKAELLNPLFQTDTSYIKIDTSKGQTLKQILDASPENGIDFNDAIKYIEQMLIIFDDITRKNYVHGDIALDNIWITGEGEQRQAKLLDFGSAFKPSDYLGQIKNIFDKKGVINAAELIISNVAIGSSHKETRSPQIAALGSAKKSYMVSSGYENAKNLVSAISHVNISADIYSCLKILFTLVTGINYEKGMPYDKIAQALSGKENGLLMADNLIKIMKGNDDMKYDTTEKARVAIAELTSIANMGKKKTTLASFQGASLIERSINQIANIGKEIAINPDLLVNVHSN